MVRRAGEVCLPQRSRQLYKHLISVIYSCVLLFLVPAGDESKKTHSDTFPVGT
jgi:hypothetical protein